MASQEANFEVSSTNKSGEMWPEIKRAFENKRFELNLTGPEISQRIETNNGALDEAVYKLKHLNFLEVARTKLSSLSSNVANIQNLTSLLCHSNELTIVPNELGKLEHLKNLDLSNNKITNLPQDLKNLRELFTLNLNGNQLDSLFPLSELKKLSVLDIGRNKFKRLPDDLGSAELENLSQIDASYNEISELSDGLADLPALKTLNLENNQIASIPPALCKCKKLKDLLIKENKLKDNRLKKLVDQDKTKAIFEYLEKAYVEQLKNKPKSEASKTSNTGKSKQSQLQSFQQEYDLIKVFHFNEKGLPSLELVMDDSIEKLRPFIVCVILRGLDLESDGNYKKFLNIQNKIHDDTCQKRTIATIATHDLKQIKTKLFYEAADPNSIQLVPLGRKNSISAAEFYEKLMEEAENERKAKKRNQLSGIYKYLTLLSDQNHFTYIRDENDVISLPPLTNAEKTRISPETRDVLVEITSTVSMESCKKVIMELLLEFINSGIVSKHDITENETKSEQSLPGGKQENQIERTEMNNGKLRNTMNVQQVKMVDTKGSLKSVYPSRVDLDFGNSSKIRVIRTYDEDKK